MACKTGKFIVIEQGRKEGLERGLEEGAEKAKREAICAVADVFPVRKLSKRFAMSEEEILKILAEAGITPKPEEWSPPSSLKNSPRRKPISGRLRGNFFFLKN